VGETGRETDRERGQEGKDRKGVETGYKQGGGTDREEGGTDTGEVGALVAIRGAVFIGGRSLSAGARCSWVGGRRRPFAFEDGGGGRSFRAVVRGWSWWGYGRGRAMVRGWSWWGYGRGRGMVSGGGSGRSRVGVLLFVGGGSGSSALGCCLLAPGGRCSWVGDGRSWVGDDGSWVVDGGGGGVMVELCGSGVVVVLSVVVGPAVTSVGRHRRCPSSRPTPVALLCGAVVVVVVGVVVRGVARR
jgi:hypothetical protein